MAGHSDGLPGYEDATEELQREEMHRIFHATFSTVDGRKCFNFILNDLHYFDICKDQSEQALANYAKLLVNDRLGMDDTIEITNNIIDKC